MASRNRRLSRFSPLICSSISESDHKNIMRLLGVGEVTLIAGLYKVACDSKSEVAKVQAYTTLGKWLGMAKEVLQGSQGITVIMQGPGDQTVQIAAAAQVAQQQP